MSIASKKDGYIYKEAYKAAERWQGIMSTIIHQANTLEEVNNTNGSNADELVKLKGLLDSKTITKSEFEIQKKAIMSRAVNAPQRTIP